MATLVIKFLILFLKIIEIIALKTEDERLLDQVIIVKAALAETGWKS